MLQSCYCKVRGLFFVLWEIRDDNFLCAARYVGTKKEAADYKYRFTIATSSGMDIISMCFIAQSFLNDIENILQPGECVTLHYGTVAKFLDAKSTLTCEMEVYKVDSGTIDVLRKCDVPPGKLPCLVPRIFMNSSKTDQESDEDEMG